MCFTCNVGELLQQTVLAALQFERRRRARLADELHNVADHCDHRVRRARLFHRLVEQSLVDFRGHRHLRPRLPIQVELAFRVAPDPPRSRRGHT